MLKVSAFYLEKQKSFIPEMNTFKPWSLNIKVANVVAHQDELLTQ
jgi:hypothetical protein